ncbi:unnamed protein product [Allacma fusca]|uniref:Pleiotrophin/Midkine C-terminal domain-containing protein n=1 Tax=Allacma fusca TaxID=39272 RepID=A0A8J2JSL1_9HEXA|nr:unnamed protein product [Allacma fusca]
MKLVILVFLLAVSCALISAKALSDGFDPDNEETQAMDLLRRITRQAAKPTCKYQKGPWSACDPQTKKRTRTFSLKKGPKSDCEEVKILSKDCKGKRQKQKNNSKNRDRQRQNKKQEKSRNKQA